MSFRARSGRGIFRSPTNNRSASVPASGSDFAYNAANLIGIALATLFRLYSYRRWVFLWAEAPVEQHLEPEPEASTSGT